MLPVETVKEIARLGAASGPRVIPIPGAPDHVHYTIEANGKLTRCEGTPPPRDAAAGDLDTVVRIARLWHDFGGEIWYSRDGVTAVASDQFDKVTFSLCPSPQLAKLMKWDECGRTTVKQKEFILLLRTLFAGCHDEHPNLIENLRRLEMKQNQAADTAVHQGRISVSRTMMAEMSGMDKIPEEIAFRVRVFAQGSLGCTARVRVAVDPDPQNEQFGLVVIPGDVEFALAGAEAELGARLTDIAGAGDAGGAVPVYFGDPKAE